MMSLGVPARREIAVPARHDKTRNSLCDRRHIGKLRDARRVRQREQTDAAGAGRFQNIGNISEEDLARTRENPDNGLRRALIGHGDEIDSRTRGKRRRDQVAAGADTAGRIIQLARIGFRVVDEFLDRMNRKVVVDGQRHAVHGDDADRGQFLDRVVVELMHQRHDRELRATGLDQRVAILGGVHCGVHADDPAAADTILNHERLAEYICQTVLGHAHQQVGDTAGPIWNDDLDGPCRPILGICGERHQSESAKQRERAEMTNGPDCHCRRAAARPIRQCHRRHARTSLLTSAVHCHRFRSLNRQTVGQML